MRTAASVGTLLWLLCAAPSCAFVNAANNKGNNKNLASLVVPSSLQQQTNKNRPHSLTSSPGPKIVRGGGLGKKKNDGEAYEPNPLVLKATGSDYSEAARVLFDNIQGPAAMLTGGLVPLGFLAEKMPEDGKPWMKKANRLYDILAVVSLANELVAIMYATVSSNKLVEAATRPATSVFALIKRDYELPWIGTNLHFMFGMIGFVGMIMLRAYCLFPVHFNSATAGLAFSALLGMISMINIGISEGDGRGHKLGGNVMTLGFRYVTLLIRQVYAKKSILGTASLILFTFYTASTVMHIVKAEQNL